MRTAERIAEAEKILDYTFSDKNILMRALTHPSATEKLPLWASYERLEFLGDSILGAIVASDLFEKFPEMNEGELTRLKISLVSGATLSSVGEELGLNELIVMGDSEKGTGARGMHSALENVYESLVGATYLDGGMAPAQAFIRRTLGPHMSPKLAQRPISPKSRLQEIVQAAHQQAPVYKLVDSQGPAHKPTFVCEVSVEGKRLGRGQGTSKKYAESEAALQALIQMGYVEG